MAGAVPANKELLAGIVPAYKELLAGTVPANKELLAGRVPANNLFLYLILLAWNILNEGKLYNEMSNTKLYSKIQVKTLNDN